MQAVHLGSSEAPLALPAAWLSHALLARLAAISIKSERLWQSLSSLCSPFCILLKMSEPESSSSESGFLLLWKEAEKGRREGRQRIGKKIHITK